MATVEQDGIRVTLALERSPMPAGEATWAIGVIDAFTGEFRATLIVD